MSTEPELHDFEDGNGPVPARRHGNGGGWVACTATVEDTAYIGGNARVDGEARVTGEALVTGKAYIGGKALVTISPIIISGLSYPIAIADQDLRAGCQQHTFSAWRAMTPERISAMDGQSAIDFYPVLIGIIDLLCKDREAAAQVAP